MTLALNAIALEVVYMDYSTDTEEITSYEYYSEGCSCVCEGY